MRTIVYIDGFNLYHGMRDSNLRHCYWLDLRAMAVRLLGKGFKLETTKYFTARVSGGRPSDTAEKAAEREGSRIRQLHYLEALESLKTVEVYEGRFLMKRDHCRVCKKEYLRPEEKATDVQIATELLADAFLDRFDSAILVSGDADLVPPVRAIQMHFPNKPVVVAFPPRRFCQELMHMVGRELTINVWTRTLERCQLPDVLTKADGTILSRPFEWR